MELRRRRKGKSYFNRRSDRIGIGARNRMDMDIHFYKLF
jgi:hypothetical protein